MITVTAKSTFHDNLSQSFRVPAEPGRYPRRCPDACDGRTDRAAGIQIRCGCGWPCHRTEWDAPDGYDIYAEWADAGRENIIIVVDTAVTTVDTPDEP